MPAPRIAVIGNTSGAVFSRAFDKSRSVRDSVKVVLVDGPCGLVDEARARNIPVRNVGSASKEVFDERITDAFLEFDLNWGVVFFTHLFRPQLVNALKGRLLNFHPTLLPEFPGIHGLETSLESKAPYLGATVHVIDETVDAGPVVLQGRFPNNSFHSIVEIRHRIHLLQTDQLHLLTLGFP